MSDRDDKIKEVAELLGPFMPEQAAELEKLYEAGPMTQSRCLLCGAPLDDDNATIRKQREGRHTFQQLAWTCTCCGATNTAERRAHLAVVAE